MKKIFLLISLFLIPLILTNTIFAGNENTNPNVIILGSEEIINDDYFVGGEIVEISGTVNGDVYAAGEKVIINGTINGDLLVTGGNILIGGEISQDVRAIGEDISITGKIGKNATLVGVNITVKDDAAIDGSLVAGAREILLSGPIEKNVRIGAGILTISNNINGKVEAGVTELTVSPDANVAGDLTYWSDVDASIDNNAQIGGTITRKTDIPQSTYQGEGKTDNAYLYFWVISSLVSGMILIHFMPKQFTAITNTLEKNSWRSAAYGFAGLILIPIVSMILLVLVLTIPLSFIMISFYFLTMYLSKFFFMLWIGKLSLDKLGKKTDSLKQIFLTGLIIVGVLKLLPLVSGFVSTVALLMGLGAMLITIKDSYTSAKKKSKK